MRSMLFGTLVVLSAAATACGGATTPTPRPTARPSPTALATPTPVPTVDPSFAALNFAAVENAMTAASNANADLANGRNVPAAIAALHAIKAAHVALDAAIRPLAFPANTIPDVAALLQADASLEAQFDALIAARPNAARYQAAVNRYQPYADAFDRALAKVNADLAIPPR